jgi:hypothetical protein
MHWIPAFAGMTVVSGAGRASARHIAFSEQTPPLCLLLKIYGKQAFYSLLPICFGFLVIFRGMGVYIVYAGIFRENYPGKRFPFRVVFWV